jgi:hypothetical protein
MIPTELQGERRANLRGAAWQAALALNVVSTGVLLGQLQWGVFFMLQSYLASTAVVYLLGTICWLLGSLLGLVARGGRGELFWAAGMVASYYAFARLAAGHPYQLGWLTVLLPLIAFMGCYAGRFFRYRAGFFAAPKWLFFTENCGFVLGIVLTIVALFTMGSSALLTAPLVVSVVVLGTALSLRFHPRWSVVAQHSGAREPLTPAAIGSLPLPSDP